MSDIYLCSFYSSELTPSAKRFIMQTQYFGAFKDIFLYNEKTLDKDFKKHFKDKLLPIRGFGYWVWKPKIILESMNKIKDGDILIYADIGCHFVKKNKFMRRFRKYIKLTEKYDALTFYLTWSVEKKWTKETLFRYFKVEKNKKITDTHQRLATVIFMKKTKRNTEILEKYLKVFYDDFSLVDDSASEAANDIHFIEHRHDQSVFSVLSKIYNLYSIKHRELEAKFNRSPIQIKRDKIKTDDNKNILEKIVSNNMNMNSRIYKKTALSFINLISSFIFSKEKRNNFKSKMFEKIDARAKEIGGYEKLKNMYDKICMDNIAYQTQGITEINDDELCPCLSGKKYKDCHKDKK